MKFVFLGIWILGTTVILWTNAGLKRVRMDERQLYVSNYLKEILFLSLDNGCQTEALDKFPTDHNLLQGRYRVWRQSEIHAQTAHTILAHRPSCK